MYVYLYTDKYRFTNAYLYICIFIIGPDGYLFKIAPRTPGQAERFTAVCLKVSNLEKSQQYYTEVLQMKQVVSSRGEIISNGGIDEYKQHKPECVLTYESQDSLQTQTMLILTEGSEDGNGGPGGPIDHGLSGGRIAFGCGSVDEVYKRVTGAGEVMITHPLSLVICICDCLYDIQIFICICQLRTCV
jgi:catechol 2,3-dioxygenase-like lactoylglutathione lyase family enzyme